MKKFKPGQRVFVKQTETGVPVNAMGTVRRMRRADDGAWIDLDERSPIEGAHPFFEDDVNRSRHVMAYPDDCEAAAAGSIPIEKFGRDHWTTLLYIETCIVDGGGHVQRERMRCDPDIHPTAAHSRAFLVPGPTPPTRLKDGSEIKGHDDWSCVDDLIAADLLAADGEGLTARFSLTPKGKAFGFFLRLHRANNRSAPFELPTPEQVASVVAGLPHEPVAAETATESA
jgi:hypothetical protein